MGKADILDTENCLIDAGVFTGIVGKARRQLDLRETMGAARNREGMADERASMIASLLTEWLQNVMECKRFIYGLE